MRRTLVKRIPAAARWCALVAFLNAAVWAFVTPVLHVPDETSHFAYVQYFAETGRVPNIPNGDGISHEEAAVMDALRFNDTIGVPDQLTVFSEVQDDAVDRAESGRLDRDSGGGVIANSGQPPLYYAMAAVVYHASPWNGVTERIVLIRLMSALLAAVTTLFVYLFLRELFSEPWTWTVGALAVAFQPLFGFISAGVHPDNLLFAASAALLFGLARAFRRGLTPALGGGIGVALAVGILAKLTFFALLPGALLALLLMLLQARDRRPALIGAALGAGILVAAVGGYAFLNSVVWDRALLGGGVENAARVSTNSAGGTTFNLAEKLGYTWQLYLPRLPFMYDQFTDFPLWDVWFLGLIGKFGWLDTKWPLWVYQVAFGVLVPILLLAGAALWRRRHQLVARWPELLAYAVMVLGVMGSIGFLGIRFTADTGTHFAQARYLFPFLAFYAALVALAALGAGRRFGRPVGALLVVMAMAHGVLAQLLVMSRFYA